MIGIFQIYGKFFISLFFFSMKALRVHSSFSAESTAIELWGGCINRHLKLKHIPSAETQKLRRESVVFRMGLVPKVPF